MKKVLDVSGEAPKKKQKGSIDAPVKRAKKVSSDLPKKKAKKDDTEIRKTKAEKASESMDKKPKKKIGKKRRKASVADLLVEDKDQALARIEQHAAIAGVVLHPDDLVSVENPEAIFLKTYQRIFKRLQLFRRKMERTMKKSKTIQSRDVYAYNVLCNQTREVMADMRSLIDMSQMAETLCLEALDPMAKTSAQAVTTMLMSVQSVLRSEAPQHLEVVMKALIKCGGEIGNDLNNQLTNSRAKLLGLLTQSR
jgi:hypothetical protein